jgi:hypothetical protein
MIEWLLANYHHFVRASRWIVVSCAGVLLGIASLPRTPVNRVIAVAGVGAVGLVFVTWLAIMLLTILRPRVFAEARQRRANRRR